MNIYENLDLADIEGEIWLDIPNYDGIYQCSNYGRVKSLKREYKRETKNGFVIGYTKEIIKKQTKVKIKGTNTIALYITLKLNGIKKVDTVSQIVGITFIGEKKKGFHFQHKNKNSLDNRLINIEQVTIKISKQNDFKHEKREVHNYIFLKEYNCRIHKNIIYEKM